MVLTVLSLLATIAVPHIDNRGDAYFWGWLRWMRREKSITLFFNLSLTFLRFALSLQSLNYLRALTYQEVIYAKLVTKVDSKPVTTLRDAEENLRVRNAHLPYRVDPSGPRCLATKFITLARAGMHHRNPPTILYWLRVADFDGLASE